MDLRAELLAIADLDRGELLSVDIYGDVDGLKRLLGSSGNPERALKAIRDAVRRAARDGRMTDQPVGSWGYFKALVEKAVASKSKRLNPL
jgi:hypothetical protein